MDEEDDNPQSDAGGEELTCRPPESGDLIALCRQLNELGTRYLEVGGFAVIHSGHGRFTEDIDLIIDTSLENEAKVFAALRSLPDQAVNELDPGDVAKYTVVRVADGILVGLMQSASGIDYAAAVADEGGIIIREIDGVKIPFASPRLLWRMKVNTHREKDAPDLLFLREDFTARGETPPE